jgi:hypothetical protein
VILEVRKRQHQHPDFGHTQGEILKKTCGKSTLALKGRVKFRKPSILMVPEFTHLSFFLSGSTDGTWIFTAPTCTTATVLL